MRGIVISCWFVGVIFCIGCHGSPSASSSREVWVDQGDFEGIGGSPETSSELPRQDTLSKAVVALAQAQSCDEVSGRWKNKVIEELRQWKEQELNYVLQWRKECYSYYDYEVWYSDLCLSDSGSSLWDAGGTSDSGEESASEYSTTNVQVVGVDEADWLKNDGKWMYVLANQKLHIIDAWPPEQAHTVSQTLIQGRPIAMFVHDSRAVVFSSIGSKLDRDRARSSCTYGYDCEFTGDGGDTLITVFNLSNKSKPEKVREIWINGSYLTSRRVERIVYPVIHFREPQTPTFGWSWSYPDIVVQAMDRAGCGEPIPLDPEVVKEAFEELYEQKKEEILSSDFTKWLPSVRDIVYKDGIRKEQANPLTNCDQSYVDQMHDGMALLSVISFDMTKEETLTATSVLARPGAVFATRQSLYLAIRHRRMVGQPWYEEMPGEQEATTVHKFRLFESVPGSAYEGSGIVKGRVLNQFSMGEYEGRLQIATTTGWLPGPTENTVAVLEPRDGRLEVVGLLDGLARNEDIRAVRFNGPLAFIVTFKKTDPLFVIDMSNPTAPVVKGELKIPGFSTYIHFMDPTHLLTIGFDAQDEGDFAWFQGVMLQVFDVTDITKPELLHKEVIGTRGSASEAATDHLAFNYFAPKNWLAVPMVVCEGGGGASYGGWMRFNGLMVYEVTIENGFRYLGGIPHDIPFDSYLYWGCGQWWTKSSSTVKRSVFLDDYVVSVALDVVKFANIGDLEHPVAEISLVTD